jgi:diguanylate cyclase (GGDEF)-like protein
MPNLFLMCQRQHRATRKMDVIATRKQTGPMPAIMKDKHRLLGNVGLLSVLALIFGLVFASFPREQQRSVSPPGAADTTTGARDAIDGAGRPARSLTAGPESSSAGYGLPGAVLQVPESNRDKEQTTLLIITLACIALLFCLLLVKSLLEYLSIRSRHSLYKSSHDKLTGLINRGEFETRVNRAISHAQTQSVNHALLHIDVDFFKSVNTAFGHPAGDELLQELAQLLLSSVRKRDTLCRLGGDEFGMLLENCPLEKAVQIAGKLVETVGSYHFTRGGKTFQQGISIGMVPIDRDSKDSSTAMSAADSACYLAKEAGRSQVQIAHLGNRKLQIRHGQRQWLSRLMRALNDDRLTLYFQPIVPCAATVRHDKHVEILLRMIDDDGSIIAPGVFFPTAEKFGLARNLDHWVIEHALAWLARESRCSHWPIRIAINLSAHSVGSQDMVNHILDRARVNAIDPAQVCFELTESAVTSNLTAATGFMLTLRACGFRFSLDDFGNGLSCFAYLKKMPVDYLKIDGAIVRDFMFDPLDRALVRVINDLGHLLGKETIAKHVESLDVLDELQTMGVDHMQGYVHSHPQSLEDFAHVMGPRLVVVPSGSSRQGTA